MDDIRKVERRDDIIAAVMIAVLVTVCAVALLTT